MAATPNFASFAQNTGRQLWLASGQWKNPAKYIRLNDSMGGILAIKNGSLTPLPCFLRDCTDALGSVKKPRFLLVFGWPHNLTTLCLRKDNISMHGNTAIKEFQ